MVRPESQAIVPMIAEVVVRPDVRKGPAGRVGACRDDCSAGGENARNGKAVEPRLGSEKRPSATNLNDKPKRDRELAYAIGPGGRRLSASRRPEPCPVSEETFEVEAPRLSLCITVTNTIAARTKYPALRHADNRNKTVPP